MLAQSFDSTTDWPTVFLYTVELAASKKQVMAAWDLPISTSSQYKSLQGKLKK